ncbi:MAG: PQQ-like beta-propeller repeat protein [Planctomycetes bacterium]|nr:PQQ-like beta-propeller repeat protein [Planctomycetota bacterium]
MVFIRSIQIILVSLCLFGSFSSSFADSNWPGWRGPRGDGHSLEKGLPVEWSPRSVVWKKTLNGEGQSSPTIWGNRIFLTAALEQGRKRVVMCLDRTNGKVLWERLAWTGSPEQSHRFNGWASPTCTTDGKYVFAFFGKGGGLFCYTVDGKPVWQKNLGEFVSPWGTAACPVLVGDLVIQNCDADQNAFLAAFEKATGKQVWKTKREDFRGWSTPVLIHANGRDELVVNGQTGAHAYDPATGKELWNCSTQRGRGSPTVTPGNGLLHVVEGKKGGIIYAVRPGGNGDVTKTHRVWSRQQSGGRDLPSPLVFGKYLHVVTVPGILTCYESSTGKPLWKIRLNGTYSGCPVAYNGLVFFLNEEGETTVLKPGDKPNIVHRNRLGNEVGEIFRASITPSGGQIFIRSKKVLYCLGNLKTTAAK